MLDQARGNIQQVYGVASENLMGIDHLPEVQVQNLFECYKCNVTVSEKSEYLKHLLSFHQRTVRRYEFGTSIGGGMIIQDKNCEEFSDQDTTQKSAEMDVLVEIAWSSILETSGPQSDDKLNGKHDEVEKHGTIEQEINYGSNQMAVSADMESMELLNRKLIMEATEWQQVLMWKERLRGKMSITMFFRVRLTYL